MSDYPENWKEIAGQVKEDAGWKCVRCFHPHDPDAGYCLTVHHLDNNKSNCAWWNLAALCQRCHLHIQSKVDMKRLWFLDHSSWFVPFVAGYYASLRNLPDDKDYVNANLEDLLDMSKLAGNKNSTP